MKEPGIVELGERAEHVRREHEGAQRTHLPARQRRHPFVHGCSSSEAQLWPWPRNTAPVEEEEEDTHFLHEDILRQREAPTDECAAIGGERQMRTWLL
jgi:hypothetical protein